ncbi:MAG: type I-E CRISPR-associated protein Cas6/Cse3/CasE, partial [Ruminococcus sp.]|nr:type I-E CRISPR-associated protein Cas6/Cse3/CasE [Ruminococcus sp.]
FIDYGKRNLWRIDCLGDQLYLLLLSDCEPKLSSFCSQFGQGKFSFETKSYDGLLDRIKTGDKWQFRLTANPTKSVSNQKNGKRGKVVAHITTDFQKKWLVEKSEKNGFSVTENSFDVVQSRWVRFYKKGNKVISLISVTYEGMLEITNVDLFKNALTNGIGRGKAYGMGLLTVMKV